MSPYQLPVLATLALGAGPWLFWRSFRDLRTRRLVRDTPTAHIRSMSMGLVEVEGEVVPRSELAAPFSGQPCAYWQVEIATRGRNSWTTVHRNASGHPFFLKDGTGTALVYPHDANVRINFAVEEECLGFSLPGCYAQYLEDQHLAMSAMWRVGAMRFRERVLQAGQRVYVLGTAMPRSQAVTIAEPDAAEATGTDAWRARRVTSIDAEAAAVIRRGDNERTFIISQQSERELTASLGMRATAELVGGPLLALFGLGYWLAVVGAGPWFHR